MRRILAILLSICLLCPAVKADSQTKYVALTFDDGPSGRFTRRLLDGLQQRQVPATFFLCGYRIKDYPQLTQRIFEEGHEICLHGYSHNNMGQMTAREVTGEIEATQALLPEGCRPVFLRPPGGICADAVLQAAREADLSLLLWSVDPKDWKVLDAPTVTAAVIDRVKSGDVILLHDMTDSSVDAALAIIDRLQEQGFTFVTVSQLASLQGYDLQPGQVYEQFR
jgi:peptidoglycan/xylan/chitin deacetylase (PgdA/CDA1 family)